MRQTRSVLAVSTLFLFTLAGSDLFGWSMKDEAGTFWRSEAIRSTAAATTTWISSATATSPKKAI